MQIVWRYRGSFCANTYYGIIKSFEYSKEVSQQQLGVGVFVLLELPWMKFRVQRMFRAIFSLVGICSCYVRAHFLHLANIFVRVFVVFKHVFDNLRLVRGARRFCPSPRKISVSTGRTPKLSSLASLLFASLLKRFSACSRLNYPLFLKLFDLVATLNRISTTYHPPEPFPRRWISPRKS